MNWEKNDNRSNTYYNLEISQNIFTVCSGLIHWCYMLANNILQNWKILKK